nr:MAG TPA: hypothetical protein [Caudoviricetes sp.]
MVICEYPKRKISYRHVSDFFYPKTVGVLCMYGWIQL